MDTQRKALLAQIKAAGDGDRSFEAIITTNAVDRDNEVLLPDGMDATDWQTNPVIFWNHNYDVPIGKGTDLNRAKSQWTARGTIAERPAEHVGEWFPDTIRALMQQDIVRGVSVGFVPVNSRKPTPADREAFGDAVVKVHNRWKLLEFSVTPLPANQEALIQQVAKGLLPPTVCKAFGVEPPAPRQRRTIIVMPARPRPQRPAVTKDQIHAAVTKAVARRAGRLTV